MAARAHSPLTTLHQCSWCGDSFYPTRATRTEFCSAKCRRERRLAEQPEDARSPRACVVCGVSFLPKQQRSMVCGASRCREVFAHRRLRPDRALPKTCRECGCSFTPPYGVKRRTYCSDECADRAIRRVTRKKRKAQQRLVTVEAVDPNKVFDRDGWRCQLCGKPTPRSKRGTITAQAPELDHIIPLSRGGEHSYKNTQCACRACNLRKGADIKGQLRLFG